MPQIRSAKKALRVSQRRRALNDRWRREMRKAVRAVQTALTAGNKADAVTAHNKAQSMLDRAARRNILHPNTAARHKARLQKKISA